MTLPSNGELGSPAASPRCWRSGSTFDLELSGRENVMIGGAVLGLKRAEVLRKFNSIAEFAGIGDYMDQPVKHYSMGMRTRLAFAICAHVEAEILVVDEALAVGDAAFQRKCMDWIDSFRQNGTLLFVSHSTAEVRRLCTRAIWIEDGRIREQGESERGHPRLPSRAGDGEGRYPPLLSGRVMSRWPPASCSGSGSAGGRSPSLVQWVSAALGRCGGEPRRRRGTRRPISASWRPWPAPMTPPKPMSRRLAELARAGAEVLICVASERDEAVDAACARNGPTRRS